MSFFLRKFFIFFVIFLSCNTNAVRHAVLKSKEVNWRTGPGPQHPIIWTYKSPGWPVMAIRHWDHWWYVRDSKGASGWIHSSLLSFKHHVLIVQDYFPLRLMPSPQGSIVAYLRTGVIGKVLQEKNKGEWILISLLHKPYKGWVHISGLWQDSQGAFLETQGQGFPSDRMEGPPSPMPKKDVP